MDDIFDYDFTMGGGDQTYFGGNTLSDTSWLDNFDWSGALGNLDFSNLDLGNLGLGSLDLGELSLDKLYQDLGDSGTLLNDIDLGGTDLSGISLDQLYQDLGDAGTLLGGIDGGILGTEGFEDAADVVGGAVQQDTSESQFSTTRQNADGTITQTFDDGSTITIEKDPVTKEETVIDYTTATDIPASGGEIVPSGSGRGGPGTTGGTTGGTTSGKTTTGGTTGGKTTTTNDIKTIIDKLTGSSGNTALLTALLGGLMGLLSRGSTTRGPVGYQGGIPKYLATRGQAMAPTAGGRRPGGAGIPSLTGGVTYTAAAQGGLMGRSARYLKGGTDGMADKIQTNIDGKQPARLSHGEFVVSADVVSALGSGNSEAGANVLYDMMDRVRKHAHGHKRQIKPVDKSKVLPA